MNTEEQLIYTIWDIVRAGQINDDDPINERLMRQFLSIHRAKLLNQYYKKGEQIPDECFQSIGSIGFSLANNDWKSEKMPKVIRFEKGNYGMMFSKDGLPISVFNSEEFYTSQFDRYNKYHPKLKFINEKLVLFLGLEKNNNQNQDDTTNSSLNLVVRKLKAEASFNNVNIFGQAILVNPDDGEDYDFTSSAYPYPDELIESLINSVNAREFNLFLKLNSDEIGDGRQNNSPNNKEES